MKKLFIILLSLGLLTGCGKAADTESKSAAPASEAASVLQTEESREVTTETGSPLTGIDGRPLSGIPADMTLYSSLPFQYNDVEWTVELYAMAEKDDNGEIMLDDSCEFSIKVISDKEEYLLFNDIVQLGIPSADVFVSQDGRLHVVVKDARTAGYTLTDYSYDTEEQKFYGTEIAYYTAINYFGSIGVDAAD